MRSWYGISIEKFTELSDNKYIHRLLSYTYRGPVNNISLKRLPSNSNRPTSRWEVDTLTELVAGPCDDYQLTPLLYTTSCYTYQWYNSQNIPVYL